MTGRNLGLDSEIATINAIAELEGWAIFDIDAAHVHFEIERDDDSPQFANDAEALAHVNRLAIAGSYLHKRAMEIHQDFGREADPKPAPVLKPPEAYVVDSYITGWGWTCYGPSVSPQTFKTEREAILDAWQDFLPAADDLGRRFAVELFDAAQAAGARKGRSPGILWIEMMEANRANWPQGCGSHDFCDANMVMDEAFKDFDVEVLSDDDHEDVREVKMQRWNEAWDWARARYLTAGGPPPTATDTDIDDLVKRIGDVGSDLRWPDDSLKMRKIRATVRDWLQNR